MLQSWEGETVSFSDEMIQKVWEKAREVSNNDPDTWRKDQCAAWIKRTEHGNRDSKYGWEIDHINPEGSDGLSNLRPLQWKNNVATGEGKLKCVITAQGVDNVEQE